MIDVQGVLNRAFPRGRFFRSVAVLAGGTATAQVLLLLAMPLLTRLYTPAAFGVLAVYLAILSIAGVLCGFCFERAIPLPEEDDDARHLFALSLATTTVISLLAAIGAALAGERVAALVNTPALAPYLWLLPISLLLMGLNQNMMYWAIRKKTFAHFAQAKVWQSGGLVATQTSLGLLQAGTVGLVLGDMLGRLCGVAAFLALAWGPLRGAFQPIRLADLRRVASRYRKFPIGIASGFLCTTNAQVPLFVVATMFGAAPMASVFLAQKVIATPLSLLGTSISQVFIGEIAKSADTDGRASMALLKKLMLKMSLLGLAMLAAASLFAPPVFAVAFGETWREAGTILQILAPVFVLEFILGPITATVQVLECQEVVLYREIIRSVVLGSAVWLALQFPEGLHATLAWLAAGGTLGYLLYGALGWHVIVHRWRMP